MTLTENDRAELAKFKTYLAACKRWDSENDTLPDFAPVTEFSMMRWQKARLKAHTAIYEQVYGGKP